MMLLLLGGLVVPLLVFWLTCKTAVHFVPPGRQKIVVSLTGETIVLSHGVHFVIHNLFFEVGAGPWAEWATHNLWPVGGTRISADPPSVQIQTADAVGATVDINVEVEVTAWEPHVKTLLSDRGSMPQRSNRVINHFVTQTLSALSLAELTVHDVSSILNEPQRLAALNVSLLENNCFIRVKTVSMDHNGVRLERKAEARRVDAIDQMQRQTAQQDQLLREKQTVQLEQEMANAKLQFDAKQTEARAASARDREVQQQEFEREMARSKLLFDAQQTETRRAAARVQQAQQTEFEREQDRAAAEAQQALLLSAAKNQAVIAEFQLQAEEHKAVGQAAFAKALICAGVSSSDTAKLLCSQALADALRSTSAQLIVAPPSTFGLGGLHPAFTSAGHIGPGTATSQVAVGEAEATAN